MEDRTAGGGGEDHSPERRQASAQRSVLLERYGRVDDQHLGDVGCVARQRRRRRIRRLSERHTPREHDRQVVHALRPEVRHHLQGRSRRLRRSPEPVGHRVRSRRDGALRRRDRPDRAREPAPVRLEPDRARRRVERVVRQRRRRRLQHLPQRRPDRGHAAALRLGRGPRLRRGLFDLGRSLRRSREPLPRATAVANTTACADTSPPAAPHNLRVSGSTESAISVAWDAAVDDRGVAEYRLSVNDVDIRTTTATAATFTGLACGRSYVVKVVAADAAGNVSPSASVIAPTAVCPTSGGSADTQAPTTPSSLVRRDGTATSITLSWKPSTDNVGVAGYGIYRGTTKVGGLERDCVRRRGARRAATSYTLSVDAVDVSGLRSGRATIVAATEPCQDTQPPSAPTGLASPARTETSVTLSWQASTDAGGVAGYRVYRDGALAGSTGSTSYTVAGLTCGKSYTFGVEAYDASGNHSARPATIVSTAACSDTVAAERSELLREDERDDDEYRRELEPGLGQRRSRRLLALRGRVGDRHDRTDLVHVLRARVRDELRARRRGVRRGRKPLTQGYAPG